VQFRVLENTLGITPSQRVMYHGIDYKDALTPDERARVVTSEKEPSLLALIDEWLARAPGVANTRWWDKLAGNVRLRYEEDRQAAAAIGDADIRENELASCESAKKTFDDFISAEVHEEQRAKGRRRLSHDALKGAFIISLFRDQPRFQIPYKVLGTLQDIDTNLLEWRHKHAMLVQRMIGTRAGTGGSSGYMYLRSTVSDRYKVFLDLANLSTFLVPLDLVPPLHRSTMDFSSYPAGADDGAAAAAP